MKPTFITGDRVIVLKFYYKIFKPKKKQIVVFKKGKDFLIKRVKSVNNNAIEVVGDNEGSSKNYTINKNSLIGKVSFKY